MLAFCIILCYYIPAFIPLYLLQRVIMPAFSITEDGPLSAYDMNIS